MAAPKKPGRVYYLGRVRFIPGRHSDRLGRLLEDLSQAGSLGKVEILEQLPSGTAQVAPPLSPPGSEDTETADLLNNLLGI